MRGAFLVLAIAALGCRSSRAREADAAPVVASVPDTSTSDGAVASLDAAGGGARPLPPAERLIAPFRKTGAHGFVAMTNGSTRVGAPLSPADPLDLDRPVPVASFTKLWVAVAALRMVERGELSLDETIATALPELPARRWAASTVRELMTHTSLVPELDDSGGYFRRADIDFASPVFVLGQRIPSWTEKRGVYKYRNSEFALVGAILARRAGLPADRLLAREVFEPASMTHAGLLGPTAAPEVDLRAMGAIRAQNSYTAGAGYASANDLLAFFEALAGRSLLTPASKRLLLDGAPERGFGAFGCWASPFATDGGTTLLVERTGSFGNVRLFAAFFPDENRAVVAWNGSGVEIERPKSPKGIGLALIRTALE